MLMKQKLYFILKTRLTAFCSLTGFFFLFQGSLFSQTVSRVEPPNWWVGMKNQHLQILLYGKNISNSAVQVNYQGINLEGIERVESPNYLFVNFTIASNAKPGSFSILLSDSIGNEQSIQYELLKRSDNSSLREGFDASDAIYLLYPDRFANGDPANDEFEAMPDKLNRTDIHGRHGGDIQGIINHIEYFKNLGVTTLWLNPILENNQQSWSYHGYAVTDFYRVDPRLGSNELYRKFVEVAHTNSLKVIKDMVFNHCGDMHWWMSDLPSADWLNQWPSYTQSNYRQLTVFDPHASGNDVKHTVNGWFAQQMPDLNQRNPFLAKYLIQNSIWWIEYADLNGIRMDTHTYCDKEFMARWCAAVNAEYPNFTIVGETWYNHPLWVSYWQKDARNTDGYNSNLPVVMDFPLMNALNSCFDEPNGWETGMSRIYELLAHDFTYENTNNLLVFLDNHDKGRFQSDSTLELSRLKLGLAYILTTRGIPQLYYGTEILLPGHDSNGHGDIRRDFPGGWPSDSRTSFSPEGRSARQNELWNYTSKILGWRQNATAVHNGKLTHFAPENGVYIFFRYNQQQSVMVIINNSYQERVVDTSRQEEFLNGYSTGRDIISGEIVSNLFELTVKPRTAMIIELQN